MIISESVIRNLNNTISEDPPERGGIIGSRNDEELVSEIVFDLPPNGYDCCYKPNVEYLNNKIAEWVDSGIRFVGLFHTHFFGIQSLSEADKNYISSIMKAMPPEIGKLYFPVYVLPDRDLIGYIAEWNASQVTICEEPVSIL